MSVSLPSKSMKTHFYNFRIIYKTKTKKHIQQSHAISLDCHSVCTTPKARVSKRREPEATGLGQHPGNTPNLGKIHKPGGKKMGICPQSSKFLNGPEETGVLEQ